MKLNPHSALLLLIIALSRQHASTEAYGVPLRSRRSSSLPAKSLPVFSALHSLSRKKSIDSDFRRYSPVWFNSRTTKNKDTHETESRQRIAALKRITVSSPLFLLLFQNMSNNMPRTTKATTITTTTTLRRLAAQYWWSLPLTLCMVPILMGPVSTPHFWKMVQFDYILECPDAAFVIGAFLGSNLSYFLAGYRIWNDLPPRRNRMFCPYGGLAFWIWAAGLVSTVFHAVQSMGQASLPYAEALYYVDHGIAGAAVFYFYHVCGLPNGCALALGTAGLVCLALPLRPGYAWLHSLWHILSAAAAWMWTCQGKVARRKQLLSAVRQRVDS